MKIQGNFMIGDWVLHDGKYKKVDVNWGGAVSLSDPSKTYGSIYADKYSLEEVEPIPLKKINFADKELWMSIEYVHELQQAMRLFCIEETIKL